MADVFVDSVAVGAGTGADWTNACTTLEGAMVTTAPVAGNRFLVAHTHNPAAVTSALALTSPGTPAAPCQVLCVTKSGGSGWSGLATTGLVNTSGTAPITLAGHAYCYGLTFTLGSAATVSPMNFKGTPSHYWRVEACKIVFATTSGSSLVTFGVGTVACAVEWINTTLKFAAVGQGIITSASGRLIWRDTANAIDATGSIPTNLFINGAAAGYGDVEVRNVDFTAMGSGKNIVGAMTSQWSFLFDRCKFDAAATKAVTPTGIGCEVVFLNCDSSGTNYKFEKYTYAGTLTTVTAEVRTGTEATDGVTPIATKIVTTANAKQLQPFVSVPLSRPNSVSGSPITVTVFGAGVSLPTNAQVWMEVEYLADAASTMGGRVSTAPANILATPVAYSADASVWSGGAPVAAPFAMTATFTPAQKGNITVRVYVGVASATIYIDPMPKIDGQPLTRAYAV